MSRVRGEIGTNGGLANVETMLYWQRKHADSRSSSVENAEVCRLQPDVTLLGEYMYMYMQ